MADCGATGTTLDRTAAHLISSTIGGGRNNGGGESATRAGNAIASFIGNVAHTNNSSIPQGSFMPLMAPTSLAQPPMDMTMAMLNQGQAGGHLPLNAAAAHGNRQPSMEQAWNQSHRELVMPQQINHGNRTMQNYGPMGQQQMQMPQQMNPQMMQMNMMHQQMVMMQMAQQQHQQQQQQLLMNAHKEAASQNQQQQQQQQQPEEVEIDTTVNQDPSDEWHQNLEDEFQGYLNTYKNERQNDAASTNEFTENTEAGHEGYVEGASIDRLAAAWEEAEREFSTDDYANLASATESGYNYQDQHVDVNAIIGAVDGTVNGNGTAHLHLHYEFSQGSESYGQRQDLAQDQGQIANQSNEDKYIDLMSEGMKQFQEGNISDAILCFESELRNIDGDNADAWMMLGKCHAENDEDRKAIVCLENAVERDPYSSEALLALGVSYVNELDHQRALGHLNNWVTHNPSYAGLAMPLASEGDYLDGGEGKGSALVKLKNLLNQAKAYDEANGNLENSVQALETLGVVCNVTHEYDEAAECFRAAVTMRPDDYQLWNKLGATLANSNRSDEAQEAYQNALSIKPKYARSWLNMAIAHSNLQNFDEASRCYLQTLSLNPGAVHVWSYLRIALTCSERWDLLPLAASQDVNAFQQHFEFVQYQ